MLTPRRQEFMEIVHHLYAEEAHPVHYETIAMEMGISKWTAYDMAKGLEKMGYLKRHYQVKKGDHPGRSQVGFIPLKSLPEKKQEKQENHEPKKSWEEDLMRIIERASYAPKETRYLLFARMNKAASALEFSAYTFAFMLVVVKGWGQKKFMFVVDLIHTSLRNDLGLGMVAGTLLGMAKSAKERVKIPNFSSILERFQHQMTNLSQQESKRLQGLLQDIVLRLVA